MKVAVIGQHDWYGTMGTWVADAWEMNGHKVERIDRNDIVLNPESYDFLLYVDCSEDFSDRIPKCDKCIKVAWLLDSHMPEGAERSVNIAKKCDLVFSSNYEHGVKILEKFGIESYLLPITYWLEYVRVVKDLEVVMIGHRNSSERRKLWDMLNKNFKCFTGKVNTKEEYIDYMNRAIIVINQPTEPWDMILNNRFFEAMGAGAILLQKRLSISLIEKLGFKDGEHFFYWNDLTDLYSKIKKVLDDDFGFAPMASHAEYTVRKYSMINQCAKMESIILSKFYDKL